MARTKSLGTLQTEIRGRGEIRTNYVSAAELIAWINGSIAELYELLVNVNKDFYRSYHDITVVSGTGTYALDTDHYRLTGVDVQDGSNWYRLRRFNPEERNRLQGSGASKRETMYRAMGRTNLILAPTPSWGGTVRVWYIPNPPNYATDGSENSNTFDYIAGWEEYVITDCLIKFAGKEESDASLYAAQKNALIRRIKSMAADLDDAEPDRIRDEWSVDDWPTYWNP